MSYPIMAPNSTWFVPNDTTITRSIITEIEIMDSYAHDESVTIADSWDASAAKDGSITCYVIGTKLIIAGNGSGKISANTDSSYMFFNIDKDYEDVFSNVSNVYGLSLLDTSNTINMSYMLYRLSSITSLDLTSFDVSIVESMEYMFANCTVLVYLNISGWNTHNVTTMRALFLNTTNLEEVIGLDGIDTSNVTSMRHMFSNTKISPIPVFDTSKVTDMSYMFLGYSQKNFIAPKWNMQSVTDMTAMFGSANVGVLEYVNLNNFSNLPSLSSISSLFLGSSNLKTVEMQNFDFSNVDNVYSMFARSGVVNVYLPPSGIVSSKLHSYKSLFEDASALQNIDVSSWDVSNITDMPFMFYGCSSLGEIDVSNWDVSNVTNFDHFAAHAKLKRKGVENWNTKSAINMNAMFHNCAEEELDLSGFDVSNVKYFCQMFERSPNLKRIKGLDKWDTSSGVGFDEMFGRCKKLEEVDLSSFDTSNAKNGEIGSPNGHKTATLLEMFAECNKLRKITLGPKFSVNGDGTNTKDANKLIFPTPSSEYIPGADGNWHDCFDNTYAANNIPDRTANTYFAVVSEAFDSDTTPVLVNRGTLTKIAHAIRVKSGKNNRLSLQDFANEIEAFEGDTVLITDTDMLIVEDNVLVAESYTCGDTICGQGITGGE